MKPSAEIKQDSRFSTPAGWELKDLSSVVKRIQRGASPRPIDNPLWFDQRSKVGWVRISDVTNSQRYLFDTTQKLSAQGIRHSRYVPAGSLIMSICATVGKPVETRLDACIHDGFVVFDQPFIDQSFLYYVLQALEPKWAQSGQIGSQMNLNTGLINCRKVLIPISLSEQQAISATLADVDTLLNLIDSLIAKKRNLKQAAMQQMLTGQFRLPGFCDEWKIKRLGDLISHCSSGATPRRNRPEFYKGDICWITSGELNYNVITDTAEKISAQAVSEANLTIHPPGTFLMAITGLEAEGTRGSCGIVGVPATTNQSCMAVFPIKEKLMMEYLFHYYVFRGKELALRYCQGTKQQSYTAGLVRQLPISLPTSIDEQAEIAGVLSDMDKELYELQMRREKTMALKKGMMQELLTGKTRLI